MLGMVNQPVHQRMAALGAVVAKAIAAVVVGIDNAAATAFAVFRLVFQFTSAWQQCIAR